MPGLIQNVVPVQKYADIKLTAAVPYDEVEGSCRSAGTPDSRLPDLTALLCLEPPSPPDGPSLPAGLGSIAEDAANMEHGPSRPTVLSPPADTRGGGSSGGRDLASPLGLLLEPPPGKAVAGLG